MEKLRYAWLILLFLSACSSPKSTAIQQQTSEAVLSPNRDLAPVYADCCSPSRFPAQEGGKKPFDSYESVRNNITAILMRVELPESDVKFMPFKNKKPALSDSLINILAAWKQQGFPE